MIRLLVLGLTFLVITVIPAHADNAVFDRVMENRKITCGYVSYPRIFEKDPNTGKLSGLIYDISELLFKKLNLKVEYVETGFGTMVSGLQTHRFDMLCINGWKTAHLAPYIMNAVPLFYSTLNVFVREGDMRFDNHLERINDPSIVVSAIEGTATDVIANQTFPRANRMRMALDTDYTVSVMNVITKKADVVFLENGIASGYIEKNPGKLRLVPTDKPLRYYANSLATSIDEPKLMSMISETLAEMVGAGEVDALITKYNTKNPPSFLPVAAPYEVP